MSMALAERHREQAQSAYQKAERLNRLQSILTMAKEVASAASVPIAPGIMAVAAGIVKLVLLYPKATEGMFTLGARAGTIACSVADVLSLSDRHRRPRNVGPSLLPILVRVLGVFQDVEDFIQEEIGRTGFNRIYNRMFKVADTTRELKNRLEDSLKAFSIAAVADSNARGVEQAQYDGEFRLVRTADVRATRLSTIIQRTNVLGEQLVCRPVTMVTTGELLVMKTWKYTELCGPTESDELLKQMSADPEQLHPFIAQYFGHSLDPAQAHHYIVAGHQSATSVLSQNANPVHRFQETFELSCKIMDAIGHLRERGILWRPSQDTPIVLNNEKQPTIGAFEELATGDSVTSKSQEKQLEYVHEAVLRPLWESSFKAQSNVRQWKHYYEGLGSKEKRSIFRPDVLIVELAAVLSDRPLSEQLLESQQKRWRLLSTLPSATGDRSSPSLAQVQSQRPLLYTEGAVGSIPQDRSIGFLRLSRYRVIQRILELCDIMRVWDVHGFSLRMPATAASPHGARVAAGTVVTTSGIVVVCPLDFWTGCINMSTGVAILDRARAAHLPNAELVSFALARLGNAKHTTAYTHFAMHATSWARLARVETRDLCLVAPDIKKKVASGTFTRLVSLTKDGAVVIEDILRRMVNHP